MKKGFYNRISDVPGVRVGHKTLTEGAIQTGVTVVLPSEGNLFKEKLAAACHVINGFGKTSGLVQIEELGTLESPIALTNTLSVGTVQQALVKYMLQRNAEIGTLTGTVNVVVGECNDGYLNDIRACAVQEQDVFDAIDAATADFALGSVGAGTGMSCFEMKGGIGSASRIVTLGQREYAVGALVLSNFGRREDFHFGSLALPDGTSEAEKGSIILLIATNIPMDARQLKRLCKRAPAALARLGSWLGSGSGDIAIAFSTGNVIRHFESKAFITQQILHENHIDVVFRAAIEACEEAILTSLIENETRIGRDGNIRYSLKDTLKQGNIDKRHLFQK